ncbi:MAG: DUF4923 family protein [Paludibacteraceae bacterium]
MKLKLYAIALTGVLLFTGCDTLNNLIGRNSSATGTSTGSTTDSSKNTNGSVLTDILNGVFGTKSFSQKDMVGVWNFQSTACTFETDNLLKKAGGAIVASQVENEFNKYCEKMGINRTSTSFTFKSDSTYSAKLGKIKLSGKYLLDPSTGKLTLTYMLGAGRINGYASRSGSDLKLLFDADSMLKLMKTLSTFTNNTSVEVLGKMADMYDGMLLGFNTVKIR